MVAARYFGHVTIAGSPYNSPMDLILWRHADAEPGIRDLERGLTPKGRKQAEGVAGWLRQRVPRDARILVSPARRAQQTAEALTAAFTTDPALAPGTRPEQVLAAAGWPDARGSVLVVGHQPTLGRAAALALTGASADWSVRKASAWWLSRREDGNVLLRAVISADLL
jgi:phosphohistidine phosphatase